MGLETMIPLPFPPMGGWRVFPPQAGTIAPGIRVHLAVPGHVPSKNEGGDTGGNASIYRRFLSLVPSFLSKREEENGEGNGKGYARGPKTGNSGNTTLIRIANKRFWRENQR